MPEICLNSQETIEKNFCGNCRQKKYKRIDRKYVVDEIQYTALHMNKGLLYSLKNLIKNPGRTARHYIDGNRVNHYKPLLMTFVLGGFSAFISHSILHSEEYLAKSLESTNVQAMTAAVTKITSYISIITLLLLPLFALTTKIAFKKWGHNYYEHIVMNAYIVSFYTVVNIVMLYPIMYFLRDPAIYNTIGLASLLVIPFIIFWFFKGFYADKSSRSIFLRSLAVFGLVVIGYIIFVIIIVVGMIGYSLLVDPQYFKIANPKIQ